MLEWEKDGDNAGQRTAKLDVATIGGAKSGALDWNQTSALEEAKTATPESRIAMKARYFDADDGRYWHIELVNGTPAPVDETARPTPGRALTPEGAKRLVMVLLNCLGAITGPHTKEH